MNLGLKTALNLLVGAICLVVAPVTFSAQLSIQFGLKFDGFSGNGTPGSVLNSVFPADSDATLSFVFNDPSQAMAGSSPLPGVIDITSVPDTDVRLQSGLNLFELDGVTASVSDTDLELFVPGSMDDAVGLGVPSFGGVIASTNNSTLAPRFVGFSTNALTVSGVYPDDGLQTPGLVSVLTLFRDDVSSFGNPLAGTSDSVITLAFVELNGSDTVLANFRVAGVGPVVVPEPAAVILAGVGGLLLAWRRAHA